MADIVIRGMEMPEYCYECPCHNGESGYCQAYKSGYLYSIERPAKCPLVSLPKGHGRLIDADALLLDAGEVFEVCGDGFTISGFSREQIENAPTIIDADLEWKMRNCCCFSNDPKEGGTDDG